MKNSLIGSMKDRSEEHATLLQAEKVATLARIHQERSYDIQACFYNYRHDMRGADATAISRSLRPLCADSELTPGFHNNA